MLSRWYSELKLLGLLLNDEYATLMNCKWKKDYQNGETGIKEVYQFPLKSLEIYALWINWFYGSKNFLDTYLVFCEQVFYYANKIKFIKFFISFSLEWKFVIILWIIERIFHDDSLKRYHFYHFEMEMSDSWIRKLLQDTSKIFEHNQIREGNLEVRVFKVFT